MRYAIIVGAVAVVTLLVGIATTMSAEPDGSTWSTAHWLSAAPATQSK